MILYTVVSFHALVLISFLVFGCLVKDAVVSFSLSWKLLPTDIP